MREVTRIATELTLIGEQTEGGRWLDPLRPTREELMRKITRETAERVFRIAPQAA